MPLGTLIPFRQLLNELKAFVTPEQLVAPVAAQGDFHVFSGKLGNDKSWNRGGVRKRFIELAHQAFGEFDTIRRYDDLMVFRAVHAGDHGSVFQLIKFGFFEADGKGLYPIIRLKGHGCNNRTGIDAAT